MEHNIIMFPEGMRSHNAQLRFALSGSALIASRSGAPILPIGITGTEKIKGVAWLLRRPRIMINIGLPFYTPPASSKLTKGELVELNTYIMKRIAELLPQGYRGEYTEKEEAKHEN